jgi:hypothetical protein
LFVIFLPFCDDHFALVKECSGRRQSILDAHRLLDGGNRVGAIVAGPMVVDRRTLGFTGAERDGVSPIQYHGINIAACFSLTNAMLQNLYKENFTISVRA